MARAHSAIVDEGPFAIDRACAGQHQTLQPRGMATHGFGQQGSADHVDLGVMGGLPEGLPGAGFGGKVQDHVRPGIGHGGGDGGRVAQIAGDHLDAGARQGDARAGRVGMHLGQEIVEDPHAMPRGQIDRKARSDETRPARYQNRLSRNHGSIPGTDERQGRQCQGRSGGMTRRRNATGHPDNPGMTTQARSRTMPAVP